MNSDEKREFLTSEPESTEEMLRRLLPFDRSLRYPWRQRIRDAWAALRGRRPMLLDLSVPAELRDKRDA